MTFLQHVKKWNGKRISGYSNSGGQCVDQVRQYLRDVYGMTRAQVYAAIPAGNANTFFKNADVKVFRKRTSGPIYEGDICVMTRGKHGHVFVAMKNATAKEVPGFGQNWSQYRRCAYERHMRNEIIGYLSVR